MFDDECFDEFYAKLNAIVNSAYDLGEIYDQPKIIRKILKSLIEDFRPEVTVILKVRLWNPSLLMSLWDLFSPMS